MTKRRVPYGSWPSSLSASRMLSGALRLGAPKLDGDDLYWLEGRPAEGGRQVVVRASSGTPPVDVTPDDANVRTLVHEYGGGDFAVRNGRVAYARLGAPGIHLLGGGAAPCYVRDVEAQYADFAWSPDGRWLVAVEELPKDPAAGREEPANRIVALPIAADGQAAGPRVVVAANHDFASYPRFSPDGSQLAFTAWNHPQMPWDGTLLYLQPWSSEGPVGEPARIAGGVSESIFQPCFSPDGLLTFVSDRSGWWNLYRLEADGKERALCPQDAEFGRPQWVFGMSTYAYLDASQILCSVTRAGSDALCRLDIASGALEGLDVPYTSVSGIGKGDTDACFVAASPESPACICRFDCATGQVIRERESMTVTYAPGEISRPEAIEFDSQGGRRAFAFFYPPQNPTSEGPEGELPPLIVKSHGGPTSAALPVLNLGIQYWTSRGFAVVDVNYGGSSGYGREYRERLRGRWGVVDVEDCVAAARHLAEAGQVDPERLVISGGSAGGYTTLCALTFHDVFSAGASHYGIGDLEALARDTHKFESRYTDGLVGPYPEAAALYRERSPIHATSQLSCPVIFFQGLEDRVVPPNQAEAMVAALDKRGVRRAYVAFEGEQHGFRRAENIRTALEGELYFYGQIFGFEVDVAPGAVRIVG